jgi:hypothetical protein
MEPWVWLWVQFLRKNNLGSSSSSLVISSQFSSVLYRMFGLSVTVVNTQKLFFWDIF